MVEKLKGHLQKGGKEKVSSHCKVEEEDKRWSLQHSIWSSVKVHSRFFFFSFMWSPWWGFVWVMAALLFFLCLWVFLFLSLWRMKNPNLKKWGRTNPFNLVAERWRTPTVTSTLKIFVMSHHWGELTATSHDAIGVWKGDDENDHFM